MSDQLNALIKFRFYVLAASLTLIFVGSGSLFLIAVTLKDLSGEFGWPREVPSLVRGDLIALLDTGGYAESQSANFNAQCRPATVLVSGDKADIITERERLEDVMGRFRVPPHLLAQSFGKKE